VIERDINANWLEHDVSLANNSKPSTQTRRVNFMRTEIVKHDRFAVQKWFDVDKLPRPASFVEDAQAHCKTIRPQLVRLLRPHQILRASGSVHPRQ
jgi:hypothetical protein